MAARGTGVLLVVLTVLAGWLWLVEGRPRPRDGASEGPPLLAGAPGAVARVELSEGETPLVALRRDERWVDPAGRPWPDGAVADLLETLRALRPVMVVDSRPDDPGDYGFASGASRLELRDATGASLLALQLGERNPAWTGLYVRFEGRPEVVLVGAILRWELEKLRDARPVE
jgi:hypothetical protein